MQVIGHQHIGVDGAVVRRRRFGKPGMQPPVIVSAKEDRLTVVAALDHMQRLIGQEITAEARHAATMPRQMLLKS
jgi:hypothetical protein